MNRFQFLGTPFHYVGKAWSLLKPVAEETGACRLCLFADLLWSYIRYGVTLRQFIKGYFYLRKSFERKNIVTFLWHRRMRLKVNQEDYVHYLEVKSDFNTYFSKYTGREWLLLGTNEGGASFEQFRQFCYKHNSFIVKPIDKQQGEGIYRKEVDDDLEKIYAELNRSACLIEEIIVQHPKMNFANKSVNTIRIYSLLDKNGKCHLLKSILRVGVGDTVVDNYAAGGCIYQVDNELGFVNTNGVSKYKANNKIHPGTDIIMMGYKIPNWEIVKQTVIEAAETIPQIRYIGWDVAVTENGCVLIEGNHDPDYELLEFIGEICFRPKIKELI